VEKAAAAKAVVWVAVKAVVAKRAGATAVVEMAAEKAAEATAVAGMEEEVARAVEMGVEEWEVVMGEVVKAATEEAVGMVGRMVEGVKAAVMVEVVKVDV